MTETRLQRLISQKLEDANYPPLPEYVTRGRGEGMSWRLLAAEVAEVTGEPCSAQNLHSWFTPDTKAVS